MCPRRAVGRDREGQCWLIAAVVFGLLLLVVFWPLPWGWRRLASAHHDTLFNMWRLSWIAEALSTAPTRLFDPPIFHPTRGVLAFSDAVLLQGALAAPWLWAGVSILPVANALLLIGPWASAMGAALLTSTVLHDAMHDDTRSRAWLPAGLVAGAVFGYLPYRVDHAMHLELQWAMWMPLTCWALHRTVRWGRVRDGLAVGLFVLAQFLSGIYYGVFLVVVLLLTAPLWVMAPGRAPLRSIARALSVGAVVCLVPLAVYAGPYRTSQRELGTRGSGEITSWSATPASYLSAPEGNRLYGATSTLAGPEARLFPGVIAAALGLVGLVAARRRRAAWPYPAMLALAVVFSFGLHTPVYRALLAAAPMLQGLRAPARFAMVAALALAVLSGLGAAALLARLRTSGIRHIVAALLVVGLAIEYASTVDSHAWVTRAPLHTVWLRNAPPGSVVVDMPLPLPHALPGHEAEWTFHARAHGLPTVNGYSGYYPTPYLQLLEEMRRFPDDATLRHLVARGVRYIVVHEDRYTPQEFFTIDLELRRMPGVTPVGRFEDPAFPVTVFELNARP